MPIKIRNLLLPITVVLLAGFAHNISFSAEQDFFDLFNLEIDGKIHGFLPGDFNGDENTDIAVFYSPVDNPVTRYIALFLQKGPLGFDTRADYLAILPRTAAQANAADIDDDEQSEILIIDADGVVVVEFSPTTGLSNPNRLIKQKTIFSFPQFFGIIVDSFLFDINESSGHEIILPTGKGYTLFERGENNIFQIVNQLTAPIFCHNPSRRMRDFSTRKTAELNLSLGTVHVMDGNLDGRQDIYLLWDRKICCYFQDSTGNFSQTPEVELAFYPSNLRGYFQSQLVDFNGDGRPDVAVSYTSGGITNAETSVRLFAAGADGRIERTFRKEIRLSDSHCNFMITDYDSDNLSELVIPAVELGAMAATKIILMKKTDLNLLIYPFESGMPVDKPDKRREYEFRFNFDAPQPIEEVWVNWSADYNGDRFKDLVFSGGSGVLRFYWGLEKDYLSKKPDLEISIDHPLDIYAVHLNKGEYADLIISHDLRGRSDHLTVLKNKNNKP
jgi:hypothetical protein